MSQSLNPAIIPLFKKKQFLAEFSEDDFRDKVVRPLYILKGLVHGKDVCGTTEEGKDCYFWGDDIIRGRILYAVQTKRGDIKMSANARDNVLNAIAQVKMALGTTVKDVVTMKTFKPDCVVLAASGTINTAAQRHITDEIGDTRLVFRDADALIPEIDDLMPEFWYGIDVNRLPYLKALREHLINQSDSIDMTQIGVDSKVAAPITDDTFVQLYLHRYTKKLERSHGKLEERLDLDEIPIQNVLKRNERRILLAGAAGFGKTTTLRRLAMILVQNAIQSSEGMAIPIFLTTTEITRSKQRIAEFAAEATKKLSPGASSAFDQQDLVDGNVVLLLDGFDELTSEADRTHLLTLIDAFCSEYKKCQVILTSRDYPFVQSAIDSGFVRFNISNINIRQAGKIIDRLSRGKSLSREASQELLRRLDAIHGMELCPLLVTVFVATTDYARTDIPANITELFKKFTEMMLGRWDQSKGLAQQYQSQVKDFLLSRIAFSMHSRRVASLPLSECRLIIETDLRERGHQADIEVLFDEILHRSGLVRINEGDMQFRHLLIQEFFAGRGIPSSAFLQSVIGDFWWTRPIVFYFGERPGDHNSLLALQNTLQELNGTDLYQAAVASGLAIQACYLAKTVEKVTAMESVVEAMARTFDPCLNHFGPSRGKSDTIRVVMYYLYGRDAVASKVIGDVVERIVSGNIVEDSEEHTAKIADLRMFWCIAGLIESGQMKRAEELIEEFRPGDLRLLLALHMGAFYVENVHFTSKEQKSIAKQIRRKIEPQIDHLRHDVLDEFKDEILELRSGKVSTVEQQLLDTDDGNSADESAN